jgi:Apea-like HEPN
MATAFPPVLDPGVTAAASKFLTQAFAEARRQQIIPKVPLHNRWQRYDGPWPPYWECWEIARSDIALPLIAALRKGYPDRFGTETKFQYKDPEQYVRAFLQAVIAESVIQGDRLAVKSPATLSMLHELHRVVSIEGQRFACLWLIDDVDFTAVAQEKVGEVTLFPPSHPAALRVSMLLPGALWASEHGYPSPGAKHGGLLYALGSGQGHHWDVTTRLNNAIGRSMQALRLATATTSPERMVWVGEPTMIHVEMPEAHPQTHDFAESHWRRVAKVTPDDLPGLRDLTAMVDRLEEPQPTKKRKQGALPAIVIAIRRHSRSYRVTSWQDSVLELATAMEACLGPRSKEQEIGLTLRTRAAHLLAHDDSEQADAIYKDITDLYGVRSDIIHGNPEWTKDLPKLWSERGYAHVFERDRTHALLDRWRDIVRRAISARLMLADPRLGTPLWPLVGDDTPVDRFLARRDRRDEWRARIVDGAAAYGLPLLADAAPPLIDYLRANG